MTTSMTPQAVPYLLSNLYMRRENIANLLLRLGVAFAFLYPAIAEIYTPDSWIGYFPHMVRGFVPDLVLLHSFGAVEAIIALWILSNKKIFLPSLAATAILLAIVYFDFNQLEVVFRDVAIAGASASLMISNMGRKRRI